MLHQRKGDAVPEVELPITPMLDMTFQLLAFFILTYQPAAVEEGQLEFSLPAKIAAAGAAEPEPSDVPLPGELDLKADVTVTLKAQRDGINDGAISAIVIQSREGETSVSNLEALARYLKNQRTSQDLNDKTNIQIQADSKLKYAFVIDAMDTCIRSGFQKVGLAAPPDQGAN